MYRPSKFPSCLTTNTPSQLINGKANFDCNTPIKNYIDSPPNGTCIDNAGLSMFKLQSGKKHLMRFINSGAEGVLFVSIDNHEMEVVAQDFVPLVPYNTTHLILGVGQRNDVIFYADGAPTDSLWLRVVSGPRKCESFEFRHIY